METQAANVAVVFSGYTYNVSWFQSVSPSAVSPHVVYFFSLLEIMVTFDPMKDK